MKDRLVFSFDSEDPDFKGAESFSPLLELWEKSILPTPTNCEVTGKKMQQIAGFKDDKVIAGLEKKKHAVELSDANESLKIVLIQMRSGANVSVWLTQQLLNEWSASQMVNFFLSNAEIIKPHYARCAFDRHSDMMVREHYDKDPRGFFCPGLFWLNLFGPEEAANQGGEKLIDNPFTTTAVQHPYGLFLQVGEDPVSTTTPEGIERLVKATKAMPPLGG